MPRAHRYYLPGHVWHITHRCHQQEFFLKFARDRKRWIEWLFEAKMRYGLCVLNYVATSNHIHLLVRDCDNGEIARSLQLVAGRVAQEYNLRKKRKGAFWEDRYHATAVSMDGGYAELLDERQRYCVLDREALQELLGISGRDELTSSRRKWVDDFLESMREAPGREACWTESLAVGSVDFVRSMQGALGQKGNHRQIDHAESGFVLRETELDYHVI